MKMGGFTPLRLCHLRCPIWRWGRDWRSTPSHKEHRVSNHLRYFLWCWWHPIPGLLTTRQKTHSWQQPPNSKRQHTPYAGGRDWRKAAWYRQCSLTGEARYGTWVPDSAGLANPKKLGRNEGPIWYCTQPEFFLHPLTLLNLPVFNLAPFHLALHVKF